MKRIQEYFKEADKDKLIRAYIYSNPITISCESDEEYKYHYKELYEKLDTLIEKIKNTNLKESNDEMVFIIHHTMDIFCGNDDIICSLFKIKDIKKHTAEYIDSYAYEFDPLEETVGYYVADTYLTQYYIEDVLIDFLHEMSFFGFDQEYQQQELDKIKKSAEECEKHKDDPGYFRPISELWEKIEDEYGWKPEERDKTEKEAYDKLIKAIMEYNETARNLELKKTKALLKVEERQGK